MAISGNRSQFGLFWQLPKTTSEKVYDCLWHRRDTRINGAGHKVLIENLGCSDAAPPGNVTDEHLQERYTPGPKIRFALTKDRPLNCSGEL